MNFPDLRNRLSSQYLKNVLPQNELLQGQFDKKLIPIPSIRFLLRMLSDQPELEPFDEVLAASRITAPKADDRLNGTGTTEAMT